MINNRVPHTNNNNWHSIVGLLKNIENFKNKKKIENCGKNIRTRSTKQSKPEEQLNKKIYDRLPIAINQIKNMEKKLE